MLIDKINSFYILLMSIASRDLDSSQLKVFVRLRPIKGGDYTKRCARVLDKGVAINYKEKIYQYYYDDVFDQDAKQQKVFSETCRPILDNVLEGCNGALFVYGQTGTGKTYTMGTLETIKREDQGLIPLSLKYLFQSLADKQQWTISLSFLQIYLEDIYDLLNHQTGKLQIREDLESGETYVENLTVVPIINYKQSIQLINQGLEERKTGPQKMNQLSSRSHTIVSINVVQKVNNHQCLISNFSLIDLAGSQRVKKSNSTGIRLQQAKFINSSLSALGNVIAGLAQNDQDRYIPYRSSKLTRVLRNCLSGRSRVAVICTMQTSQQNAHESNSTLKFADRCKQIRFQNQPVINIQDFQEMGMEKTNKQELQRLRVKEKEYIQTIKSLKQGNLKGESQRELELSQLIEMIFRIFGEMNSHLKKIVQGETSVIEPERTKPVQNTSIKQLKQTVKGLAQQTIDQINTLSSMAAGGKGYKNNIESQTLSSIILELVRSNLKSYETQLKQQKKQPLEKQFMVKEYEKEIKQGIISKLKAKKLKIVNNFQQIWADSDSIDQNLLQSLLNNLRKGQLSSIQGSKPQDSSFQKEYNAPAANNPKDILKRITKEQSQRKQKQLSERKEIGSQKQLQNEQFGVSQKQKQSPTGSPGIKYFQKSGIKGRTSQAPSGEITNSNFQIKKLLDTLMAQNQEKRNQV